MTRGNDYLDAVTITGFFIMFGPFLFQLIMLILTGSSVPQNINAEELTVVTYIRGFFFFTGLFMLLYAFLREGHRANPDTEK